MFSQQLVILKFTLSVLHNHTQVAGKEKELLICTIYGKGSLLTSSINYRSVLHGVVQELINVTSV